ncbi:MAG: hypothetical protein ACRDGR_09135 [bacterium]
MRIPSMPHPLLGQVAAALFAATASAVPLPVADHFESAHVHPVEISPDGTKLFVVHTADHKLSVFDLAGSAPVLVGQVPVGLEPVTVRARTNDEVWVVNHLSDSISLVKVGELNVVRTLLTGDEPTDVVFDAVRDRAFVCVSQEDLVRVWNTSDLDAAPVEIPLTMSDPRSLAIRSGSVWVASLDSQNRTTAIHFQVVQANGGPPPPNPPMSGGLPAAPDVGLIVRHDGTAWRDESGASWSAVVPYTLLDHDVIEIDAASLAIVDRFLGVGTTLFNIAVNPANGELFVTNQEASNEVRFEPNLQGSFVQNRVTRIDTGSGTVTPVHLNPHIDYGNPAGSAGERALSLSTPMDIVFASDGSAAYVAAMGSAKVGVLDAAGHVTRRIPVGQGPSGLALDEARNRLYVVNRFASTLSVVELSNGSSVEIGIGFDGSHPDVVAGRRFLYDGELSSSHGDLACASCHVFGAMDNIAWDLGDPTGVFIPNFPLQGFHPMKGPMATQSLKGLTGSEPFHWRGDRDDFQAFNPAFVSLMGRATPLSAGDMQAFEHFVMTMQYPPSPNRNLDGTHLSSLNGANPAHGEDLFRNGNLVGGLDCVVCHTFPTGENGTIIPGQLLQEDQDMKVPQLRNMYEKTRFDNTQAQNVRGFGYIHDGSVDDLFTFLDFPGFDFATPSDQEDVAAFLLAFPGDAHAAVGAQWTMDGTNEASGIGRVNTLVSLANQNIVGLIAKGRDGSAEQRGWAWENGAGFRPDRAIEAHEPLGALLAGAGPGAEITFTAVPKGNELRLGIDQDGDGYLDRDERDVGSDPGDPDSTPPDFVGAPLAAGGRRPGMWLSGANPARFESRIGVQLTAGGPARLEVFDLGGRRVRTLLEGRAEAGGSEHVWDLRDMNGRPVSSGVYFVRLSTADASAGERVVVLR